VTGLQLFFIGYPSCLGSSAGLAEANDNVKSTPDNVAIVPSTSFIPYSFEKW
jgi:predicted naringenin-chalcone synthase